MIRALSCTVFVVLFVAAPAAMATVITQTLPYSGTPNYTQTLTFNEFDDLGGTLTLQSIEVIFGLNVDNGTLILDNDGDDPASGNFEFGAKGNISSTDVTLQDASSNPVTGQLAAIYGPSSFSLAGNTGDGPNDYDPSAPDGMQYDGGPQSDSDSGFIGSTLFSQYIGTGTYDIDVNVLQWLDYGGVGGIEYAVTPVSSSGSVTVVYTYIPEPATMGLLVLGALAVLIRRRHK